MLDYVKGKLEVLGAQLYGYRCWRLGSKSFDIFIHIQKD